VRSTVLRVYDVIGLGTASLIRMSSPKARVWWRIICIVMLSTRELACGSRIGERSDDEGFPIVYG